MLAYVKRVEGTYFLTIPKELKSLFFKEGKKSIFMKNMDHIKDLFLHCPEPS